MPPRVPKFTEVRVANSDLCYVSWFKIFGNLRPQSGRKPAAFILLTAGWFLSSLPDGLPQPLGRCLLIAISGVCPLRFILAVPEPHERHHGIQNVGAASGLHSARSLHRSWNLFFTMTFLAHQAFALRLDAVIPRFDPSLLHATRRLLEW
jgi:hypothetical protein